MKHSKHAQGSRKRLFFKYLLVILFLVGLWNVWKPLPSEINKSWESRTVASSQITFLTDTTYIDAKGKRVSDQQIFDEVLSMIRNAKSYIFIDMFLWNDFGSDPDKVHRALSSELANALIAKKKENPKIVIQVVSDPINSVYGGQRALLFDDMEKAGIIVSITNLPALRDSNPILSSAWRVFVYPIEYLHTRITGTTYTVRAVPNILGGDENVTVRAYLTLLNFKANHRKLIVTDETKGGVQNLVTLVTSANPHDGSSAHSNVAVQVRGSLAEDVLGSEKKVVELAGNTFIKPTIAPWDAKEGTIKVKLITDRAILDEVIATISTTKKGDTIDMLMFYLSERHVVKALTDAAKRGVTVRLILDPNKDAFGKQKNGIPNRQIADKLVSNGAGNISVRWCSTHGEQCHGKMLVIKTVSSHTLILGSANLTRRNIGGYNLESNISAGGVNTYTAWKQSSVYFEDLWSNNRGTSTLDYMAYQDTSKWKKIVAWIMENTGLGTF